MKKALCTFAVDEYAACLEVSRPGFQRYAAQHGYQYVEYYPTVAQEFGRPASWGKIILMIELLMIYDVVIWIDCDVLILEYGEDILTHIPDWAIQAITRHYSPEGDVPSAGLWIAKPDLLPYLEKIWEMDEYLDHNWWEQAALHHLLGYVQHEKYLNPCAVFSHETELYRLTYFFDVRWHSVDFRNYDSNAYIMHFPSIEIEDRVACMQEWLRRREDVRRIRETAEA